MRMEGESRGGWFAGEDVWHNDPCVLQVVIESSVCRRFLGEGVGEGDSGGGGLIRVITHAW